MNCPTTCPICILPISIKNNGIICRCQHELSFRVLLEDNSENIKNYSLFIWLPYQDKKKQWHRLTFFWRNDNYWEINLYTDKHKSLAQGTGEILPAEGWKILQRAHKLMVFS